MLNFNLLIIYICLTSGVLRCWVDKTSHYYVGVQELFSLPSKTSHSFMQINIASWVFNNYFSRSLILSYLGSAKGSIHQAIQRCIRDSNSVKIDIRYTRLMVSIMFAWWYIKNHSRLYLSFMYYNIHRLLLNIVFSRGSREDCTLRIKFSSVQFYNSFRYC